MDSDIQIYCNHMAQIRDRINVVQTIMVSRIHIGLPSQPPLKDQTAELICVQFRKILEGIAFSSLAANKEEYSEVHANFSKHWRAKNMLAVMDQVNPDFFPIPMPPPVETSPGNYYFGEPLTDGVFTRDDFSFLYKCASEVLHSHNPYREGDQIINMKRTVQEWVARLQKLLAVHRTHLLNGGVWVVQIPGEGKVKTVCGMPYVADVATGASEHSGRSVTKK
jgi:hypothetical protein